MAVDAVGVGLEHHLGAVAVADVDVVGGVPVVADTWRRGGLTVGPGPAHEQGPQDDDEGDRHWEAHLPSLTGTARRSRTGGAGDLAS